MMDSPKVLRPICLVFAGLAVAAGGLGMLASLLALSLRSPADVMAGVAGFVAGAILIAAGLVSMTMLATRPAVSTATEQDYSDVA